MKRILLFALFLCCLSAPVYAQSTLALQEKCAEGAKKVFGTMGLEGGISSYECHYDRKLDKCFILTYWNLPKDNGEIHIDQTLADVFGNKPHASYTAIYDIKGSLVVRNVILGDTQFNVINGREFNQQTKKWDIASEAYLYSLQHPFSDPMKEKFDKWVKPYMEE
jgi:hypothetical protein